MYGQDGERDSDISIPTITLERTEHPSALELMSRNCTLHLPIWCQFLHPSAKRLQGAELRATIQVIPNPLTKW